MVRDFRSIPYREGVIISFNVMADATKSKINQEGQWNMRQIKFRNQISVLKLYYSLCSVVSFSTGDAHALKRWRTPQMPVIWYNIGVFLFTYLFIYLFTFYLYTVKNHQVNNTYLLLVIIKINSNKLLILLILYYY